jgi:hypothetical protein
LTDHQHFTIDEVLFDGEPLLPKSVANKFITQCGVLVRDMVSINIQEWNKPKPAKGDGVSYVSKIVKDKLWENCSFHISPYRSSRM